MQTWHIISPLFLEEKKREKKGAGLVVIEDLYSRQTRFTSPDPLFRGYRFGWEDAGGNVERFADNSFHINE